MQPDSSPCLAFRVEGFDLFLMEEQFRSGVLDRDFNIPKSVPGTMDKPHPSSFEGFLDFV
jgi:hypothetical protein